MSGERDITKFFDNVDHVVLRACLHRKLTDVSVLKLLDKVVASYSLQLEASKQGLPIGNLTSQIFANIYLNEFDRYVRGVIKPLAYIRYGDDFLLFGKDKSKVLGYRTACAEWLYDELRLNVHKSNNKVIAVKTGVHFLGHQIYANNQVHVDGFTTNKMLKKVSPANIAVYKAMHITEAERKLLSWRLAP